MGPNEKNAEERLREAKHRLLIPLWVTMWIIVIMTLLALFKTVTGFSAEATMAIIGVTYFLGLFIAFIINSIRGWWKAVYGEYKEAKKELSEAKGR